MTKKPAKAVKGSKPDGAKQAAPTGSRHTRYQSFRIERVQRQQLLGAPYNPRQPLHPELAQRLRDNLANVGLIEPLVWNKVTGYLVGGHQRLAALDVLTGHGDYSLDVSVVELDPKVERTQNVFLNNPAVHGDWDIAALATLFKQPGFEAQNAGFAQVDVLDIFGQQVHDDIFGAPQNIADELNMTGAQPAVEGVQGDVLLVLFDSRTERERFMVAMGRHPNERYIDAARVLHELAG